jgi:hypothetical protein
VNRISNASEWLDCKRAIASSSLGTCCRDLADACLFPSQAIGNVSARPGGGELIRVPIPRHPAGTISGTQRCIGNSPAKADARIKTILSSTHGDGFSMHPNSFKLFNKVTEPLVQKWTARRTCVSPWSPYLLPLSS